MFVSKFVPIALPIGINFSKKGSSISDCWQWLKSPVYTRNLNGLGRKAILKTILDSCYCGAIGSMWVWVILSPFLRKHSSISSWLCSLTVSSRPTFYNTHTAVLSMNGQVPESVHHSRKPRDDIRTLIDGRWEGRPWRASASRFLRPRLVHAFADGLGVRETACTSS